MPPACRSWRRPPRIALTPREVCAACCVAPDHPFAANNTSSECCRKNVVRSLKRDALRPRNRRRQRPQERRPVVVDLPSQQHRVVLVDRVVAMLHEHAAEVTELLSDGDGAAGTETIHVLAPSLSGWNVRGAAV